VKGDRPSGYAMNSLGYRALCAGQFSAAVSWFQKALKHMTDQSLVRPFYYESLLADGKWDELLGVLRSDIEIPDRQLMATYETAKVYALRGDRKKAFAALARHQAPDQAIEQQLDLVFTCVQRDMPGFLKASRAAGGGTSFELAFLQGDLKHAAELADQQPHNAIACHALIYLAAARGADKSLAKGQWKTLLEGLRKAGREERSFADLLEGRKPPDGQMVEQIVIDPKIKRVLLAVLAQRNPGTAATFLALAKKLDYERNATSLCLRKVLGEIN
jgi:tetratricopeptide (TPR) repeat protein